MTMTSRAIVFTLVVGLFVPTISGAQRAPKMARIAFLCTTSSPDSPTTAAFVEGLRDLGYVEGKNITIEWRWGGGSTERFPQFAAEAVQLNVDVIVAANDSAGRAAQKATNRIPIVIAIIGDPVASGFASTLGRPGGNITGSTTQMPDVTGKRLQLLNQAVPSMSRVAFLVDTNDQSYKQAAKDAVAAARSLGLTLRIHEVKTPSQLIEAFANMATDRAEAVLVGGGTMFYANRLLLAQSAINGHLAMMCQAEAGVNLGCLMSYGGRLTDSFRRAAYLVDKVLKGTNPADLPIEQPTIFELVVNKKTASTLGVVLPRALLLMADKVVE